MTEHEKLNKISDLKLELSILLERSHAIASDIDQDYFDLAEDEYKIFYFSHYGVLFDVLFDYLIKMGEQVEKIDNILVDL